MRIVYSNASAPREEQKNANNSIGGFLSNTPIPNGLKNNIFSFVTNYSLSNSNPETKLIGLWNNSEKNYENVTVKFIVPENSIFDYEIALVYPTDCDGSDKYEVLSSSSSIPYYAVLEALNNNEDYIIGKILSDKSVGIWIKRTIKSKKKCKTSVFLNSENCDLWKEKYNKFKNEKSCEDDSDNEVFDIQVSFDYEVEIEEGDFSQSESESESGSDSFSLSL